MQSKAPSLLRLKHPRIFYGWYIVGVGFLSHLVCAFHLSSTLSVFLKPLTEDLGVSRGLFSLLRSGEIVIGALMAPFIGTLVDRYGGRWLMAGPNATWPASSSQVLDSTVRIGFGPSPNSAAPALPAS